MTSGLPMARRYVFPDWTESSEAEEERNRFPTPHMTLKKYIRAGGLFSDRGLVTAQQQQPGSHLIGLPCICSSMAASQSLQLPIQTFAMCISVMKLLLQLGEEPNSR